MTTTKGSRRRLALRAALGLFLASGVGPQVSGQNDPHLGIWELNVATSTFSPGPPPRSQTLTFQAAGPHWIVLLQGIDASGSPISPDASNLAINFDGRDHATPNVDFDTSAWKRINDHRYEVVRKRGGKVVLTATNVVSSDGKTMTITTRGVNAAGQAVNNVGVYDKRSPGR